MSFEQTDEGINCETVNNEMYFIPFNIIQRISSYKCNIFSGDEHRLEIETSDYETYTFSEREDCWLELMLWVKRWADLPDDWQESAYTETFLDEITVLWQSLDEL